MYISIVQALINIHDLNMNPLAIVPLGKARIQTGFIRIVQPIEFIQFKNIIQNFDEFINKKSYNHPLYHLLQNKKQLLYQTYSKLCYEDKRQKRWDRIGTVLKWIAGTPDAEDLHVINNTMNNLIIENNRQVLINQGIDSRIQHMSQIVNHLSELDSKSQDQHTIEINLLMAILNIDTMQHQIEILEDAILLAKNGIPSSRIFHVKDLRKIQRFLETQQIIVKSFEELLSKCSTHVSMNETHIMYMIKIPQLSQQMYDYEYIDLLIQNGKQIIIGSNYILTNETNTFELREKCSEEINEFICNYSSLKLPNNCTHNLIQIKKANCIFAKVFTKGIIKRISESLILLNSVNVTLKSNCSDTQILNGSFLIQFEKCEIQLDNDRYANFIMSMDTQSYRPTTGLDVSETDTIETLSTEFLVNLTLDHRKKLKHIYLTNSSFEWKTNIFGTISIGTFLTVITCSIIYMYIIKRKIKCL